jgi:hypothetical protein
MRFVLQLAGVDESRPPEAEQQLARHAARVHQWPGVIAMAHREGALPLLARLAASGAIPALPATDAALLQRMAPLAQFRAGVLESRLVALSDCFAANGVPMVLLKGAAVATTVYQRFADRAMGDLDVLVPADRGAEAFAIARGLGWQLAAEAIAEDAFGGHQHLRPLKDGAGLGVGLDLHTHVVRPSAPTPIDGDRFRREASPWGRTAAAVPTCEDLLLHACIHFVWSHSAGSGAWKAFRDVRQLLRHAAFDADRFERLVRESRAASCAFWTLHLAHELGGVAEARALRQRFAESTPGVLTDLVTRHFTSTLTDRRAGNLPLRLQHRMWEVAVQPARHRHGAARPWDRDEQFIRQADRESTAEAATSGRDHHPHATPATDSPSTAQRLTSLFRYVRALLHAD